MSNNNNAEYLRFEIPESSKDVIIEALFRPKDKIMFLTFSEKFDRKEVVHIFNPTNLDKAIKVLHKKIRHDIPNLSENDLYKVEDMILRNASLLSAEFEDENTDEKHEQENESRPEISYEEWQKTLKEKYEKLKGITSKNFPEVWQAIEFTLAVKNILHIKGNTLPFAGIILGSPSSSKTLALEMLRKLEMVFYTDSFTAKSFVSHITTVNKEDLEKIDMLPRIKNKLFLTPELAPLFSARDEDLQNVLGIVTRILDGHGYESDSGACGHRGYTGEYMFTWVGASVEIPRKVYKLLGNLGPKLYFYRMVTNKKKEQDYLDELKYVDHEKSKLEVKDALLDYTKWFDYCPGISENGIVKIECDQVNDDDIPLRYIVKIGILLSRLRGVAQTWETNGTQGSDYGFYRPIIEHPTRAITCLRNLALGHALNEGRGHITLDDLPIIIKTALSTAPVDRVIIFDLLLKSDGVLTSSTIIKGLGISRPTALKTMAELDVLGLVELTDTQYQDRESQRTIKLKNEFEWFLSSEFRNLRGGFIPEKFEEECKEKSPPPTLKKYDDGEDFDYDYLKQVAWEEFKQIEANEITYENDYLVVEHTNLRSAILRNPYAIKLKITREAADKSIEQLLNQGMISKLREGWYYSATKDDNENNAAAVAAS